MDAGGGARLRLLRQSDIMRIKALHGTLFPFPVPLDAALVEACTSPRWFSMAAVEAGTGDGEEGALSGFLMSVMGSVQDFSSAEYYDSRSGSSQSYSSSSSHSYGGDALGLEQLLLPSTCPTICICLLAVLPPLRRKGVASAMLKQVEQQGSAAGAEMLFLHVMADNCAALALYHARGYRTVGRVPGFYQVDTSHASIAASFCDDVFESQDMAADVARSSGETAAATSATSTSEAPRTGDADASVPGTSRSPAPAAAYVSGGSGVFSSADTDASATGTSQPTTQSSVFGSGGAGAFSSAGGSGVFGSAGGSGTFSSAGDALLLCLPLVPVETLWPSGPPAFWQDACGTSGERDTGRDSGWDRTSDHLPEGSGSSGGASGRTASGVAGRNGSRGTPAQRAGQAGETGVGGLLGGLQRLGRALLSGRDATAGAAGLRHLVGGSRLRPVRPGVAGRTLGRPPVRCYLSRTAAPVRCRACTVGI